MLLTVFTSFLVLFFVVLLFDLKNHFCYFSERFSLCMGLVFVVILFLRQGFGMYPWLARNSQGAACPLTPVYWD